MKDKCPFLTVHKNFPCLDSSGTIYRCILADVLLKSGDINKKWACGGCSIPKIMNNPCRHLKPHKDFQIRGSSNTWFTCELFNVVMISPEEFCQLYCKIYET